MLLKMTDYHILSSRSLRSTVASLGILSGNVVFHSTGWIRLVYGAHLARTTSGASAQGGLRKE